jgi:hypothetical protein
MNKTKESEKRGNECWITYVQNARKKYQWKRGIGCHRYFAETACGQGS